ncbi:MAG: fibronectin type III domain-containing protein [Candidatus Buchananbacteria bacterium]
MKNQNKIIFLLGFVLAWTFGLVMFGSLVWAADIDITATVPVVTAVCGNTTIEIGEQCESTSDCTAGYTCSNCQCIISGSCTAGSTVCSWGACLGGSQSGMCSNGCSSWSATQACSLPVCGNGLVETGEECDDNNIISGDGCSGTCQNEVGCGNGVVETGEQCDDNNIVSGDCCASDCKIELVISQVAAIAAQNSAVVSWQTACQNTDSILEWGKTIDVNEGSASLSGKNYSYEITGLTKATTYYFRIIATAPSLSASHAGSFITLGASEICDNNLDDDSDGLVDQADPNCPCQPNYSCQDWEPDVCPVSGVQTRICTQTNVCWQSQPAPEISRSCGVSCQLSCGLCQNLNVDSCSCDVITPCCGNGSCDYPSEDPFSCAADCPVQCLSDWECTAWSPEACPASGIQTRDCFDKNACQIPINQPVLQQTCGSQCPGLACGLCENLDLNQCVCEQLSPCCGNGVCENGESNSQCPADCIASCLPSWNCSAWSECSNQIRTRSCNDTNNCNLNLGRPPEILACGGSCGVACGLCQEIDLANCQCLNTVPCCGNRICESQETIWSCGVDCGIPPGASFLLNECLDGVDNDKDGFIDYPADKGCASSNGKSETNLVEMMQNAAKQISRIYIDKILNSKQVQAINRQLAAPVLVTTVAVNTASSVSLINFLSYLRYIFSQPFVILFRRRRTKWGTVYNSLTKQPIDLAIVRLYRQSDNRIIQSRVTDRLGRFLIMADPGEYYITVTKPNFVFPTVYLRHEKEDIKYLDLYHGEPLRVSEDHANITINIPIDPQEQFKPAKKIIVQYYLRKLQYLAAFSSIPLAFISLVLSPGLLTASLLVVHTLLFVFFLRLSYQKPPKSWGIIYDKNNKIPLARTVTRIYDKKYNKLLETRITDNRGRYSFLVNNNVYYVTTEKLGYAPYKTNDIDLISQNREAFVNFDIGLNKSSDSAGSGTEEPIRQIVSEENISHPTEPVETGGVGREVLTELLKSKESGQTNPVFTDSQPPQPILPAASEPEKNSNLDEKPPVAISNQDNSKPENSIFG